MRLLIVALAVIPLGAAAAEPPRSERGQLNAMNQCPQPLVQRGERPKAEMKKLIELPAADAFHAVYRVDGNGCIDPVMVGYQYRRR